MDSNRSGEARSDKQMSLLLESANRIFRPLARLFLGRIPCDVAVKLLKLAYVHEGRRRLQRESRDKRVTKSALALLIGLDSRTISNLEKKGVEEIDLIHSLPYSSVLGMWVISEEWRDPETGRPRKLRVYGPGRTFQTLVVKSIGKNISYQTVLDYLVREGNLRLVDGGQFVELRNDTYQALSHNEAVTLKTGSLAIDFAVEMVHHNMNLRGDEERWPAHIFWADHIPAERMPEVRARIRGIIEEHARDYEQHLEPLAGRATGEPATTAGIELFYWEKPTAPGDADAPPDAPEPQEASE